MNVCGKQTLPQVVGWCFQDKEARGKIGDTLHEEFDPNLGNKFGF